MIISNKLKNSEEYIFSKLAKKVAQVEKTSGRKVLNLGIGSPTYPPSKNYLNKLKQFIDEPDSHLYPGYGAIPEFSESLIKWYKSRFLVSLDKDETYSLLGAKDGIVHLPLALLNEGDEVLIPDPGYPAFSGPLLLFGIKPVFYNLTEDDNFKLNLVNIKNKVSTKTKIIWLNFPSNPTGQVISKTEIEKLVAFCKQKKILIVHDNVYSEITFAGYKAPSILQIKGAEDIAVEIGSFSKSFALAGFRMAWIVGNKDAIKALAKVKSQLDTGMSIPLQKLGAYALNNFDNKWHKKMISEYEKRRTIISARLKSLSLKYTLPTASLYLWAKIPGKFDNSEEFCMKLLEERQILLTPGSAFGKNGVRYIRASISSDITDIAKYF